MDGSGEAWQLPVWRIPSRLQVCVLFTLPSPHITVTMITRYIVTAAHCLFFDTGNTQPMAPGDVTVTLGEHDR